MGTYGDHRMPRDPMHIWLFVLFALAISLTPTSASAEVFKIGVLAKRGAEATEKRWHPTADHLNHHIPDHHFTIVPLDFDEIDNAVKEGAVDFILTNSSIYVQLEAQYNASRITTLMNSAGGQQVSEFGGVIFTRSDNPSIFTLDDLKGKSFAAVDHTSLGGFQMAWRELKEHQIDPFHDFIALSFVGTHDAVVHAVLNRSVDAGTVRTDTLETMANEGLIELKQIRVIRAHPPSGFPTLISTRLYPEWPMARLQHTPPKISKRVAMALMEITPDSLAARMGQYTGWTVPKNYQPVHELLRELQIGPYAKLRAIYLQELKRQYRSLLLGGVATLLIVAAAAAFFFHMNRRLTQAQSALAQANDLLEGKVRARTLELAARERELRKFRDLMESTEDAIFILDPETCIILDCNATAHTRLGYGREEMIGAPLTKFADALKTDFFQTVRRETARFIAQLCTILGERLPVEINSKRYNRENEELLIAIARDISERERYERALMARELKFRALFQNAYDAILILSPTGTIEEMNDRALTLFGGSNEAFLGESFQSLTVHNSPLQQQGALFTVKNKGHFQFEGQFTGLNHNSFPGLISLSWVPLDDAPKVQAIIHDLSEQKEAEKAKHKALALLEEAQQIARLGSWEWQPEHHEIHCSRGMLRLFDLPPEPMKVAFETFLARIHPDDQASVYASMNAAAKEKTDLAFQCRIVDSQNLIHYVQSQGHFHHEEDALQPTMIGVSQDITPITIAQHKLRGANRAYRILSQCNQSLVRAQSEDELLATVLDHVTKIGNYAAAWIGYPDKNPAQYINPKAMVGEIARFLTSHHPVWPNQQADATCPASLAIWHKAPQMIRDVQKDGRQLHPDLLHNLNASGLHSTIALPLQEHSQILGVLCIYSHQTDAFLAEETALLQELAADLAFGIVSLRAKQKLAETNIALHHSQEQLQLALDAANEGLWDWNITDDTIFFSPRWLTMLGYNPEDLAPTMASWQGLIHPEDTAQFDHDLNEHLHHHTPLLENTHRLHRKDGSWLWVMNRGQVVCRDSEGHPMRASGTIVDITELRTAQEQEQLFKRIMDQSSDGIMIAETAKGRLIEVNQQACKHLQHSRKELLGEPIETFFTNKEEWQEMLAKMERNGQFVGETQQTTKSGELLPLEVSARLVQVHGTDYMVAVARDISERLKMQSKLRQSATVFENTTEGVLITNSQGNIISVNPAFTTITGLTEEEALGQNPNILSSGRHSTEFYQQMWEFLEQKGYWRGEIWNRRKNGETFPEWLNISCIRNEAGEVMNYVGVFSDITDIKRSQEQLDYLAHHDPLTNLPNRLLFNDRLDHSIRWAKRNRRHIALLFIDLDRFKNINDTLGHAIGDALLQQLGKRLSDMVRDSDTVARIGGDEFTVLLETINKASDAALIAEKIVHSFQQPFIIEGRELFMTTSIGISIYPEDGNSPSALMKHGDAAMYRAKADGRNNYQFYSAELTKRAMHRFAIETRLRQAIDRNEFTLVYQPQVHLFSGRVIGFEALLRWQSPAFGDIPPSQFIPIAEDSGLIIPIGEWVLWHACQQMCRWQKDALLAKLGMAVNVSANQFATAKLPMLVADTLQHWRLPPQILEVEITESGLMRHGSEGKTLSELKEVGIKLAIDDFGTGYSSLSYLRSFPVDKLKIDKSFIHGLNSKGNGEIVEAIIALARVLELNVVAEGVETKAQEHFLLNKGCQLGQGYLYTQPLAAAELEPWLLSREPMPPA